MNLHLPLTVARDISDATYLFAADLWSASDLVHWAELQDLEDPRVLAVAVLTHPVDRVQVAEALGQNLDSLELAAHDQALQVCAVVARAALSGEISTLHASTLVQDLLKDRWHVFTPVTSLVSISDDLDDGLVTESQAADEVREILEKLLEAA